MLLLSCWLCLMALFELAFDGYFYRFFLSGGGEPAVRATLVLSNLVVIMCAVFTLFFLRLYQHRAWHLVYLFFIAVNLANLMRTAFGDLFAANVVTGPLLLLFSTSLNFFFFIIIASTSTPNSASSSDSL